MMDVFPNSLIRQVPTNNPTAVAAVAEVFISDFTLGKTDFSLGGFVFPLASSLGTGLA